MTTTVLLARHGRTAWHHPTRYAGDSDIPLDSVGATQAEALGAWAAGAGLTSLRCSDLQRSRRTAEAVARTTGLAMTVDPRLREPHFGLAEGRTVEEVRALDPGAVEQFYRDPVRHPWPGAEDTSAVAARGLSCVRDAAAADPGGRVLVVAHSTLIRLALCLALGIDLAAYRQVLPRLDPATLTELRVSDDGSVGLLRYNAPAA